MFEYEDFIKESVIHREDSIFNIDVREYEEELKNHISRKSILVIGGAGSIGSSFVYSILKYEPSELYIVDTNENALTELTRWFRSGGGKLPAEYRSYPMDYSSDVFRRMFSYHKGFDIVANFSAHKHVRSEKDIFSIEAMLKNNVINAMGLLETLGEYKPEVYFCVSTDKAANPVNIMGASKRIMEDMIFSYSDDFDVKTARFANVAFSNGSLLNGFVHRISNRQPLSAPKDVKRYFVSQREAGEICMMSAIVGNNREIFFPKLNDSQMMTFDDIAVKFLEYMGYDPDVCSSEEEAIERAKTLKVEDGKYPVYFSVSDTSGEKQFEEFYTDKEDVEMNRFQSLGVVKKAVNYTKEDINLLLGNLRYLFNRNNVTKADVIEVLSAYLPDFHHIETGLSLDSKM